MSSSSNSTLTFISGYSFIFPYFLISSQNKMCSQSPLLLQLQKFNGKLFIRTNPPNAELTSTGLFIDKFCLSKIFTNGLQDHINPR